MNKAIKLFKYLFILLLLISVWVAINSIDESSYNDLGILSNLKTVSDNENGYIVISYLNDPQYDLFETQDDYDRLKRHIDGIEWNQKFVDKVLTDKANLIADIETVITRPHFKFPDYDSFSVIPEYMDFINASRILILKSIEQANVGNTNKAIKTLITNLKYNQKLKTEENSTLISYMIGLVMQNESVKWLHRFLQYKNIDSEDLKIFHTAMEYVENYESDGFKKVFYGEFNFSVLFFEEMQAKTLKERLNDFWASVDAVNINSESHEGNQGYSLGLFEFAQAIIPNYFYHPNETLSQRAALLTQLAGQTQNYCNAITFIADEWNPSWLDGFLPKSQSEQWLDMGTELYKDYFYRRCLSHIYYDSVRTFIGIRQYMLENHDLPDNLGLLVPNYIERLPIDYFNGETLNYSKEKGWLYSVGTTFEDNDGSENSIYYGGCRNVEPCYENPTILITPKM